MCSVCVSDREIERAQKGKKCQANNENDLNASRDRDRERKEKKKKKTCFKIFIICYYFTFLESPICDGMFSNAFFCILFSLSQVFRVKSVLCSLITHTYILCSSSDNNGIVAHRVLFSSSSSSVAVWEFYEFAIDCSTQAIATHTINGDEFWQWRWRCWWGAFRLKHWNE